VTHDASALDESNTLGDVQQSADAGDVQRPIKLLQGYVWHPKDDPIDLADHLPATIDPDVHILWDALPRAPFTFFDDGTLAATQTLYQLTVMTFDVDEASAERLLPWIADRLQEALDGTPAGVGWQIMEDLRPI
jgi:hypothetical protein